MFTGIIKYLGKLQKKEDNILIFKAPHTLCQKLDQGTSIAVNGVCLTVVDKTNDTFAVDVMPETLQKTTLGKLQPGSMVNLELPVTPKTFLSGHIIQGHVDGVGQVSGINKNKNSRLIFISLPKNLAIFTVGKGSIAINGVSLTIISVTGQKIAVGIIPITWEQTALRTLKVGDLVNIEVDVLSKYMERLLRERH